MTGAESLVAERQPKRQRLEISTVSSRELAVRRCLANESSLHANPNSKSTGPQTHPPGPLTILDRVKDFLPQLAAANRKLGDLPLDQRSQVQIDVSPEGNSLEEIRLPHGGCLKMVERGESESDDELGCASPSIVMDLACGLLDLKTPEAVEAAQRSALSACFTGSGFAGADSTEDSDSSDSDDEESERNQGEVGDSSSEDSDGCREDDVGSEGDQGELFVTRCVERPVAMSSAVQTRKNKCPGIFEL